jgi:hypothetical protein
VIDDYTGDPLLARVTIDRDELPPEVLETRTDTDGSFFFARVRPGHWRMRIQTDDHIVLERAIDVVNRGHGPRDVELDQIRLAEAGWIEGTVVDALGSPVSRASVRVQDDPNGPTATTDSQGRFALRGLAAGNLVALASHPAAGEGASNQVRILAGRETVGIVIHLSERFDPARAAALPGRVRGVAILVSGSGGQVRVRQVMHGSRAERAGLRAGDVLAQIDGVVPESASRAAQMLRGAEGIPAILEVRRDDVTATLVVERETWIPPD